jgi:GxxExxY protein
MIIVELKCCKNLQPEHQAQVINYLKASGIPVGLLINFGNKNVEYKKLHHPTIHPTGEGELQDPIFN